MLRTVLIIILILALIGGLPTWGYWGPAGGPYGYFPSGIVGLILAVVLILLLLGHL